VNETTKDNESKGGEQRARENSTYQWEHHVPVRTWARKRDRMQKRMRERENYNVSERELWRSSCITVKMRKRGKV